MKQQDYPYNDYPYQDFPYKSYPHCDYPLADGEGASGQRPASISPRPAAQSRGAAHWPLILLPVAIFIYSPFLIAGYQLCSLILPANTSMIPFAASFLFLSFLSYQLFYLLKGIYISLKSKGTLLWIPLFIATIACTCLFPPAFFYLTLIHHFPWIALPLPVAIILIGLAASLLYLLHRPLSPTPGFAASSIFQTGLRCGNKMTP